MRQLFCFLRVYFVKLSAIILMLFFISNPVDAVKADTLFLSDEIINIELRSDFTAIQKDRVENPQYHDGELIYHTPDGKEVKLFVKVMARGNFRRDPKNCNFPPLMLNFRKNEVKKTLFDNQDKLKLVTPCNYDRYVIDEYLVYKMYNLITDKSFKVRLANILYFDTGKGKKLFEKYSFFIEHEDQVAERNNSFEINRNFTPYALESGTFRNLAVFQYMVGNKDWYVTSKRNIVIMQPNDTTQLPYAIPYDFDFSAFIDADYTKPKDVPDEYLATRRVYKGLCYTTTGYNEVFALFKSLKPRFESAIDDMPMISKSDKLGHHGYLNSFYKTIENKELIRQEFLEKCETRKLYNLPEN
jgi:hypothetical protein